MQYLWKFVLLSLLLTKLAWANTLPEKQEQWIQERLSSGDLMGMVVASVKGDTVKLHTYGKMSENDPRQPQTDSQFEIGSISKVFTNLLLAEMVAKGTLAYTTTLVDLLPNIEFTNPAVGEITLQELGTHTSGLPRLPANLMMTNPADPYQDYNTKDLLEAIKTTRPDQELQKVISYSNFGVGLLGYLLGQADNSTYFEALEKHILKPLGMNTITTTDTDLLLSGHSAGKAVAHWHFDSLAGAGALRSNASRLARLFAPWLSKNPKQLVHNTSADLEIVATSDKQPSVSRTWMVFGDNQNKIYWHNGGTGGFSSFAGFNPSTNEGWIVLSNSNYDITRLGLSLFSNTPAPTPASPSTTSEDFSEYYGFYAISPDFVLNVFSQEDKLFVQATGQAALQLAVSGEDKFTLLSVDAQLVFERDAAGNINQAALHQNGAIMPAPRIAKDTSIQSYTEIKADEVTLKAYTGRFELAAGVDFQIKVENGQLMVKLSGQAWLPVFAYDKDKFFYKAVDAQLTFNREESKEVVSLTLHQNGANQTAPKR
ncbi:MAG: serine hydrolase [Xanthomonadales bacterium]|nr:serine hydrolase [Xanthomonadales bacterium]